MKPWLFDIIACPIDKHFPLDLKIFSFENDNTFFSEILEEYKEKNIEFLKKKNLISSTQKDKELFIKDNIIIKQTPLSEYLGQILRSIDELQNFTDNSNSQNSQKCLDVLLNEVKKRVSEFQNSNQESNTIDNIIPELVLLNRYKIETEINTGLIYCQECNRWFPIVDSIPQMLPDEYRERKKDLEFLENNKNLLDQEFLKQDLKPFKI